MNGIQKSALACVAILASAATHAAGAPLRPYEPTEVLSYGGDSCGRYVQADPADKSLYVAWTIGFISGGNMWDTGKGRLAGTGWDQAGVTVWLTNYCTANPLEEFMNAALGLRKAFGGNVPAR